VAVTLPSIQRDSSPEVRTKSIELHSLQLMYMCAFGMVLGFNSAHFHIRHQLGTTKLSTSKVTPIIHSRNKIGAI